MSTDKSPSFLLHQKFPFEPTPSQASLFQKLSTFVLNKDEWAALTFIILAYRQISKDIKRLKIFNKKLLISSRLMAESEVIGKFSTWQWDLDVNKIDYSDNNLPPSTIKSWPVI